jgi:hypothetical protein
MTVIAQLTIDGEQADFDPVLADFHEDDLVLRGTTDRSIPDRQMFEVQATEGEMLSQFHETCIEQQVTPTIHGIHHERDETEEPAAVEETENR